MLKLEKVASPLTAATLVVPANVPPLGFVPIASVTVPVKPVAVLPEPSCAVTRTAGLIATPAVALVGCTGNARCVAGPGPPDPVLSPHAMKASRPRTGRDRIRVPPRDGLGSGG